MEAYTPWHVHRSLNLFSTTAEHNMAHGLKLHLLSQINTSCRCYFIFSSAVSRRLALYLTFQQHKSFHVTSPRRATMPPKANTKVRTTTTTKPKPKKETKETKPPKNPLTDLPMHTFPTAPSFSSFLSAQPPSCPGIYLKLARKGTGIPSITSSEAVEVALCHGWIDGRGNSLDDQYWTVRYTPRRPKSNWSRKNVETVERLISEGKMMEGGLKVVGEAKADGRWERAYVGQKEMEVAEDVRVGLEGDEAARKCWDKLAKGERYAMLLRVETAEKGKRKERIKGVVESLAKRWEMMKDEHGEKAENVDSDKIGDGVGEKSKKQTIKRKKMAEEANSLKKEETNENVDEVKRPRREGLRLRK